MMRALKWLGIVLGGLLSLFAVLVGLVVTGVLKPPEVPADAIATRVSREAPLMAEANARPVAKRYGSALHWQQNGSYCGPASLVNVFRSLGQNVADEEEVLAGTGKCALGFCFMGLTLDELAAVARARPGYRVEVLRDLTADGFLEHLEASNDPGVRYVINFSRKPIFGAGGGHHSPIGAYLEDRDQVLVLDVNAKFAPWLIERERLFAAMDTLDGDRKRGLLRIQRAD
jgi:hypothetical protein